MSFVSDLSALRIFDRLRARRRSTVAGQCSRADPAGQFAEPPDWLTESARPQWDRMVQAQRDAVGASRYFLAPVLETTVVDDELRAEAETSLRALVGTPDAVLRADQWEAVDVLVAQRRRALVVQRTGWGKSAVYFVATMLLRVRGAGPTLIVSPLLALMRNQVDAAARAGIRARTINSANLEEWTEIEEELRSDEVDVAVDQPGAAQQPRLSRRRAPRPRGAAWTTGRRRGALHLRLGARFPTRLPSDPGRFGRPAAGSARTRDHCHCQRTGRGRCRRAARYRHVRPARISRPGEPPPRRAVAGHERTTARLAHRASGQPAEQRHHLRADGGGCRGPGRASACTRP